MLSCVHGGRAMGQKKGCVQMVLYVPPAWRRALRVIAAERGVSVTSLLEPLIEAYLRAVGHGERLPTDVPSGQRRA